jgi:hypothetical protein
LEKKLKELLTICLLFTSLNASAALNKWIDADGKVHYSDIVPADVTAQKIRNSSAPTPNTSASGVPAQKTIAEQDADWKKAKKAKEETAQKADLEKEAVAIKQKNCENARRNQASYENSPLIVSYDSKGERSFLDDAGRKQQIDEAKKAVEKYCK